MITNRMTTLERIRYRRKIKLMHKIRRLCIISAMTVLLIACFALSVNVFKSIAQDNDAVTTYKYFTSVVVEHGDTLYSLADKHTDGFDVDIDNYIEEVMHINHLEDASAIQSGQYLIIPYYSEELKGI